tara:strand:- start:477 stop:1265 length:789 start_codon:yes stop_codon:yes gene_type:complete
MKTLLIDADMLLFRTMTSLEVDCDMGDEVWIRYADIGSVRETFWKHLEVMKKHFQSDSLLLFWTGPSAFRRRIFPEYKANRAGMKKPVGWTRMKRELLEEEVSYLHDEIEADDWLGIYASALVNADEDFVIVSGDKDLDQIPGVHHWPWKEEQTWTITHDQAERQFYRQILVGDSTDNIPGCAGVGAITAERIVSKFNIAEPVECWEEIVQQFEKALKKKNDLRDATEVATLQARLVRILRATEYDVLDRTVDLWTPPTLKS